MAIRAQDSFTDTNGTALEAHTGEVGGWVVHPWSGARSVTIENNQVRSTVISGLSALFRGSNAFSLVDQTVSMDYIDADVDSHSLGIYTRLSASQNTGILLRYRQASTTWELYRVINNGYTTIGSYFQVLTPSQVYNAKLTSIGDYHTVYIDDVPVISVFDDNINSPGYPGLRYAASGLSVVKGDNFLAKDDIYTALTGEAFTLSLGALTAKVAKLVNLVGGEFTLSLGNLSTSIPNVETKVAYRVIEAAESTDLTTLAAVKTHLGIADASKDAVLSAMISRASDYIVKYTGREFARERVVELVPGYDNVELIIRKTPIESILSVFHEGEAIADYRVIDRDSGIIYKPDGWNWSAGVGYSLTTRQVVGTEEPVYKVDYYGGYWLPSFTGSKPSTAIDLPLDLELICIDIVKEWYTKQENNIDLDTESIKVGDYSVSFKSSQRTGFINSDSWSVGGGVAPAIQARLNLWRRII